jgi:hypothetical protein
MKNKESILSENLEFAIRKEAPSPTPPVIRFKGGSEQSMYNT